ncbi:hypothetical protein CfE428DRAFT_3420 [Chthoniobacter flavus Ellin428]|uniref:Uncharacterized protein n=1 Tax=Chthoniobacter flavus Ellin428 TaxID=497964 RepID=B4D3D2_9BACT|nr:hypothetical protein [Chthoniobacter flavus]EDY19243.1 hypothetical protein CfE428DRAFT_3420 [Chthoniobacter flavus Ellin428]TCO88086.1 hypothetical protein EV701_119130 [Chthoniobacter flavus]
MALSLYDPRDGASKTTPDLKALYLVLFFFVCLAFTSKDGRDRWIYGAFAVATLATIIHYRLIPSLYYWHSPF